jgi:hypothetical protein
VIIFSKTSNFKVAITEAYLRGIHGAHSGNHCSTLLHVLVKRQEMLHKFFLLVPFIIIKVINMLEDLLVVFNDIPEAHYMFLF